MHFWGYHIVHDFRSRLDVQVAIPANIRVAAAADNANNLPSSHITKGVYSLYDTATELHERIRSENVVV